MKLMLMLLIGASAAYGNKARVRLVDAQDPNLSRGCVEIELKNYWGTELEITGTVTGLGQGKHGFHIHENGNTTNQCKDAGSHFNPHGASHGNPADPKEHRHVGDLGNIHVANAGDDATVDIKDSLISLIDGDEANVMGRSIVVHKGEDNLEMVASAGSRVACGVIELGSCPLQAHVSFVRADDNSVSRGCVNLVKTDSGYEIKGTVTDLDQGEHGFHVHENAGTGNQCKDAGGHFNPHKADHGAPNQYYDYRHAGDLGNINVKCGQSDATVDILDSVITLEENHTFNVMGRSIVVHEKKDDFSNPSSAGSRVACGVIKKGLCPHD